MEILIPRFIPRPQPIIDEGWDTSVLAFFYLEQQEPPPSWQQQAQPWNPVIKQDEGIDNTNLAFFFQETEQAWIAQFETISWNPVIKQDEGIDNSQLSFFFLEQEEFLSQWAVESVPWIAKPFTDDEISTNLKYFYLEDEQPFVGQIESVTWTARVAQDEDPYPIVVNFYLEDEPPFIGAVETIVWTARPFLDDEISTNLKFFYLEDEQPPVLYSKDYINVLPIFMTEDIPGPNIGVELEEWIGAGQEKIVWSYPTTFPYDETSTNLANFGLDQDDGYFPYIQTPQWITLSFPDTDVIVGSVVVTGMLLMRRRRTLS